MNQKDRSELYPLSAYSLPKSFFKHLKDLLITIIGISYREKEGKDFFCYCILLLVTKVKSCDKDEILNLCITQVNVDDREPLKNESFLKAILGKLFVSKGYISKKLQRYYFLMG